MSGPAPFGMRWDEGDLVPEASEAAIVSELTEAFIRLKRIKAVAAELNGKGRRTRQGSWTDTAVARVLRNPRLSVLLPEELWRPCQELLRDRDRQDQQIVRRATHPLGGVVHCGCGGRMYLRDGRPGAKFICRTCCVTRIPSDTLELAFCRALCEVSIDADEILAVVGGPGADLSHVLERGAVRVSEVWQDLDMAGRCQLVDLLVARVLVSPDEISVVFSDSANSGVENTRNFANPLPSSRGSQAVPEQPTSQGNALREEDLGDLLTIEEVADFLKTTPRAVYSMVDRGQLPGIARLGRRLRVRRDDLLAWVRRASSQKERRP